jgi:hypothetical protein
MNPIDPSKFNENSTILHPNMNLTSNETAKAVVDLPWKCTCSSELEENENESECHCVGPDLLRVPQNLPTLTRLSISNAKIRVLRETALKKYSTTLRDL